MHLNGNYVCTTDAHPCPGGCDAHIPHNRLACAPCWRRLPAPLRDELIKSYRDRDASPMAHSVAVALAGQWYRDNPRPPRTGT